MEPGDFPRRILLAVTGLSPQVVTETLYALAVQGEPRFVPTEVLLVTTAEGAARARLSLLSERPGWFGQLISDYSLPPIAFGADRVRILHDAAGKPLNDIRSLEDNERAADLIIETVRELTTDPDATVHASIAGGRKTMGYYLGYALSLFGRPQDRLSHVLVAEPFETTWDFFYPTPYSNVIQAGNGTLADTADAKVTLAEIPFVCLRDGLPERLREGKASFGQTVDAARRALEPPSLTLDLENQRVNAGGELIKISPADLAFYAMMARLCQEGLHAERLDTEGLAQLYLREYGEVVGEMSGDYERAEKALDKGMSIDDFDQRKSRANGALKKALGPQLAKAYLVHGEGARPQTRYSLRIDPEAIRFASIADGC